MVTIATWIQDNLAQSSSTVDPGLATQGHGPNAVAAVTVNDRDFEALLFLLESLRLLRLFPLLFGDVFC